MIDPPRDLATRIADTRRRLRDDVDAWVASVHPDTGDPHLIPLSFWWDEADLWLGTSTDSVTVRSLLAGGRTRVALGLVRDVVLVDASVTGVPADELDATAPGVGDGFAANSGFDPRRLSTPYTYLRLRPDRILAWREENELAERVVMRSGVWREERRF